MSKKDGKLYFNNSRTYDEVLEMLQAGDYPFTYKGREYNITFHHKPCITVIDGTTEDWYNEMQQFESEKELLDNYVFPDGVSLLEAFKGKDIGPL